MQIRAGGFRVQCFTVDYDTSPDSLGNRASLMFDSERLFSSSVCLRPLFVPSSPSGSWYALAQALQVCSIITAHAAFLLTPKSPRTPPPPLTLNPKPLNPLCASRLACAQHGRIVRRAELTRLQRPLTSKKFELNIVLYYTISYYIILYYIILFYFIVFYCILY